MSKVRTHLKCLTPEALDRLPTPRLRAHLRRVHAVHEQPHWEPEDALREKRLGKLTKADIEWMSYYTMVRGKLWERARA
jgi:hypothetical protein